MTKKYKGYRLYEVDGTIAWADNGGWLDCIFDNLDTAKFFIDIIKFSSENMYNLISALQEIANQQNGVVTKQIIDDYQLNKR